MESTIIIGFRLVLRIVSASITGLVASYIAPGMDKLIPAVITFILLSILDIETALYDIKKGRQ